MMIKSRILYASLLLMLSAASSAALPALADGEVVPSLAPLVERVSPAVVNIKSRLA